eukprot:TRINITY_DN925_c2_g1_i1.p1 TRINITY_DN925_c2_g1~~TRINITY_DN925_c2_g1_i1.p1  ORF type:complete len:172 (-),score=26.06 TRINITY_DN925_c2_g1_i1:323-838(-)
MGQSVNSCSSNCRNDCKELNAQYCERADGTTFDEARPPTEVAEPRKGSSVVALPLDHMESSAPREGSLAGRAAKTFDQKRIPFTVELSRTGQNWRTIGLLVSPDDNPKYLVVDDIWEPSLISDWNASHEEGLRVKPGDVITAVNEASSSGEEMLAKIQALGKGTTLRLQIG